MSEAVSGAESAPVNVGNEVAPGAEQFQPNTQKEASKYGQYGEPLTKAPAPEAGAEAPAVKGEVVADEPLKAEEPEAPKPMEKMKVKVHGREMELELTQEKKQELVQMGIVATQKMQEAAKLRKDADGRFQSIQDREQQMRDLQDKLKTDFISAALEAGADPSQVREHVESWLYGLLQKDQMPEGERRLHEAQSEIDRLKKADTERAAQAEQQKQEAATEHYRDQFQKTIIEALDKSGLPKNEAMVAQVASLMQKQIRRGVTPDASSLADYVRDDMMTNVASFTGGLANSILSAHKEGNTSAILTSGQQLVTMLGDDVAKAIRRYDVTRLKSGHLPQGSPLGQPPETQKPSNGNAEGENNYFNSEDEYLDWRKQRVQAADQKRNLLRR